MLDSTFLETWNFNYHILSIINVIVLNPTLPVCSIVFNVDSRNTWKDQMLQLFIIIYNIWVEFIIFWINNYMLSTFLRMCLTQPCLLNCPCGILNSETMSCRFVKVAFPLQFKKNRIIQNPCQHFHILKTTPSQYKLEDETKIDTCNFSSFSFLQFLFMNVELKTTSAKSKKKAYNTYTTDQPCSLVQLNNQFINIPYSPVLIQSHRWGMGHISGQRYSLPPRLGRVKGSN